MSRRTALASLALAALSCLSVSAMAQSESGPAIVKSANIIEALNPKDIVLDGSGRVGNPMPRDPSISLQVQFGFNSAALTPWGQRQLDELGMALSSADLRDAAFELAGHTDRVGDAGFNQRLSTDRAYAVRQYLMQTYGIAPNRLLAIGYGYSRLADPRNPTAAINRRVEVRRIHMNSGSVPSQPQQGHGSFVPTPR